MPRSILLALLVCGFGVGAVPAQTDKPGEFTKLGYAFLLGQTRTFRSETMLHAFATRRAIRRPRRQFAPRRTPFPKASMPTYSFLTSCVKSSIAAAHS